MTWYRFYVAFVMAFNVSAFGIMFLMLANGTSAGDLLFIAESDGALAIALCILGVVLNVILGVVLWRARFGSRHRRDDRPVEDRPPITGA